MSGAPPDDQHARGGRQLSFQSRPLGPEESPEILERTAGATSNMMDSRAIWGGDEIYVRSYIQVFIYIYIHEHAYVCVRICKLWPLPQTLHRIHVLWAY